MHRLVRNIGIISVLSRGVLSSRPKHSPGFRSIDNVELLLYQPDRRALIVANMFALNEVARRRVDCAV